MEKIIIGPATLYCADARDVLPMLPKRSIDAIITDPPHGRSLKIQRAHRVKEIRPNAISNDTEQEAKSLLSACLPELARIAKRNTAHLFWSSWRSVWMSEMISEFFPVKGCIIWHKNQFGVGYYLRASHEIAWYCHAGKPPLPERAERDVWAMPGIPRTGYQRNHVSEKPVHLMARSISLCCPAGVILDPFAGSGSTGVAALQAGHSFVGIESDPAAFNVMVSRIGRIFC